MDCFAHKQQQRQQQQHSGTLRVKQESVNSVNNRHSSRKLVSIQLFLEDEGMATYNHPGVFFGAVVTAKRPFTAALPLTLTGAVLDESPAGRTLLKVQVCVKLLSTY